MCDVCVQGTICAGSCRDTCNLSDQAGMDSAKIPMVKGAWPPATEFACFIAASCGFTYSFFQRAAPSRFACVFAAVPLYRLAFVHCVRPIRSVHSAA